MLVWLVQITYLFTKMELCNFRSWIIFCCSQLQHSLWIFTAFKCMCHRNCPFCVIYSVHQLVLHFFQFSKDSWVAIYTKGIIQLFENVEDEGLDSIPRGHKWVFLSFISVCVKQSPLSPKIILSLKPAARGFFLDNHKSQENAFTHIQVWWSPKQ